MMSRDQHSIGQGKVPLGRSPFAGCALFAAALLSMVFFIGFAIYVLFAQYRQIEQFTEANPAPLDIPELDGREPELLQLADQLEAFRQAQLVKEHAVLELNAEELNLAIAAYEPLKELKGTLQVREITSEHLRLGIAFQLNGKPRLSRPGEKGVVSSDFRYLNGEMIAVPVLLGGEVALRVLDMKPANGASVPRGFIEQMSPWRISQRYKEDGHPLGEAMAKLTRVELGEGFVRLASVPGERPSDELSKEQVTGSATRLMRFLGVAALAFVALVAMLLLLGLRAQRKRQRAAEGQSNKLD